MNSNFCVDGFDFIDPSVYSQDFGFYLPQTEPFPDIIQDLFNYSEFEGIENAQVYQLFDHVIQSYTKDLKKHIPSSVEYEKTKQSRKNLMVKHHDGRVGTLSAEERKAKVERFLEKRKRRVYTKKISYLCRKKVADMRERHKGRFVSKKSTGKVQSDSEL